MRVTRAAYAARANSSEWLSLATIQFSQITEATRAKTSSLDVRRSYFGPAAIPENNLNGNSGGAAGYRPRVRSAYYTRHLSP